MTRIVLIEDDVDIRRLVADALAAEGHDVDSAATAMSGLELAVRSDPGLVVMDLGLPDLDGNELLRMIRAVSQVPVMVITATRRRRGSGPDPRRRRRRLPGEALFGRPAPGPGEGHPAPRRPGRGTDRLVVGGLTIDVSAREAHLDGVALDLSPKEFDLLRSLAERKGEVVTKRELLAEVWREPYGGSDRTVDVHLSWLEEAR